MSGLRTLFRASDFGAVAASASAGAGAGCGFGFEISEDADTSDLMDACMSVTAAVKVRPATTLSFETQDMFCFEFRQIVTRT